MAATDATAPDRGSCDQSAGAGLEALPFLAARSAARLSPDKPLPDAPSSDAPSPTKPSRKRSPRRVGATLRAMRLTPANDAPINDVPANDAVAAPSRSPSSHAPWPSIRRAPAEARSAVSPAAERAAGRGGVHALIPALIVVFLLAVALVRGLMLLDMHSRVLDEARGTLDLTLRLVASEQGSTLVDALDDMGGAPSDVARSMADYQAERVLMDAAASVARSTEAARGVAGTLTLALVNARGTIVADSGAGLAGSNLADVVHDGVLLSAGHHAGVRDVTISGATAAGGGLMGDLLGGTQAIAGIAELPTASRNTSGARLVIWRFHADVLGQWRDRLSASLGMFALTFAMLMVLLTAYFSQADASRDRDERHTDRAHRMESALGRGRCGLWQWDVSRGSVRWTRSMYEMLGLAAPEGGGPDGGVLSIGEMRRHLHPEDDFLMDVARDVMGRRTEQMDVEFRMRHADGEWVWVRARCALESGQDGPFLSGIAMDVTSQREVERARRTAEERLDDAVRNVNEAFVLWDADDRLVMCNDKFREWHELPAERIAVGTPRQTVLSPSQRAARTKALGGAALAGERAGDGHPYEMRLAGGRWLQVSERRMSDGSIAAVGTDVTELKERTEKMRLSEAKLRASVASLNASEARRRQRERELESAKIEADAQREAAEKANAAKSDFMANMSHELRTPLNAILGFSEMMASGMFGPLGADDDSARRYSGYASDINGSAAHLLDVIGDILDMSRIEAQRFELTREEIDICPVVEESVRTIALKAAEKGITVDTAITRQLSLHADERAMKQVLINLLSNAVKFTPEGGRIKVAARRRSGFMRLSIADTGVGIPKDAIERVVKPFEQVQDRYTRAHDGSGLGLAISQSLIAMHGGRMRLSSEVGVGTTVTMTVPLAASDDAQSAIAA